MHSTQQALKNPVSPFAYRMARILDRIEDWQRYIRAPQEMLYKYAAAKRAGTIMEQPEMREVLLAAERERERSEQGGQQKYTNIERYIPLNLRRIYTLGLHKSRPLTVLDIGAGAGFFLYLCKLHGHDAMGFDANQEPFYQDMHKALGVPCRPLFIHPETALPDFGKKFDLITAFAVCFHRTAAGTWSVKDWRFFLNDLLDRHCADGGCIHLHLHDFPRGDRRDVRAKITASFPKAMHSYHSVRLRKKAL